MNGASPVAQRRTVGSLLRRLATWIVIACFFLVTLIWFESRYLAYLVLRNDLSHYQGLSIGAPMQEAVYFLGEPDEVLSEPTYDKWFKGYLSLSYRVDGKDPKNIMPKNTSFQDYHEWMYNLSDHRLDLTFDRDKKLVSEIGCYVNHLIASAMCPPIFGIDSSDTEDSVVRKLGQPTTTKYSNYVKVLVYQPLGLEVWLEKRRVYMIEKVASAKGVQWHLANMLL